MVVLFFFFLRKSFILFLVLREMKSTSPPSLVRSNATRTDFAVNLFAPSPIPPCNALFIISTEQSQAGASVLLDGVDVVQEVVDTATKLTAVNGSLATLEQLLADQLVNVYTSMYSQKSVLKKDYGDRIKAVTDNLVVEGGNVESLPS